MAISPDAQKAGMTDEQWNALSEEQRADRRRQFDMQSPAVAGQATVSNPTAVVPPRNFAQGGDDRIEGSVQSARDPGRPDAPVVQHTEAQRAGMGEDQWKGLSEDQRDAHRRRFADPSFRTDAQRAGLTPSQWDALTTAEQNRLRARFPDPTPEPVTTPSPPDYSAVISPEGHSPSWEQPHVPHVKTEEERAADAKRDPDLPNPDDDLRHLPNTPGGRNNPTMTNYDPSRPATE